MKIEIDVVVVELDGFDTLIYRKGVEGIEAARQWWAASNEAFINGLEEHSGWTGHVCVSAHEWRKGVRELVELLHYA